MRKVCRSAPRTVLLFLGASAIIAAGVFLLVAQPCKRLGCKTGNGTFSLEGRVINATESESIYLSYPVQIKGVWYEQRDTAKIIEGRFRFTGHVSETTPAYLSFDNMDEELLYIEPTRMQLKMDRLRPYEYELSGLSIEKEYRQYRNALGTLPKSLFERHRHVQIMNRQWLEADACSKDSLMQLFYDAAQAYTTEYRHMDSLRLHFITGHQDYAIVPHMLFLLSRSHDFDQMMLQDLFDALPIASKRSVMGQLAHIQIGFETGDKGWSIGKMAPDFSRTDATGQQVRLSDFRGEYFVLLDFWASWCGPCLKALPEVKALNSKYGDRGLRIIGVSSDEDKAKWLHTVTAHSMNNYPQILSIEQDMNGYEPFFSEQADIEALYHIEYIPSFVLIDKQGRIIARWRHIGQEQYPSLDQILS